MFYVPFLCTFFKKSKKLVHRFLEEKSVRISKSIKNPDSNESGNRTPGGIDKDF